MKKKLIACILLGALILTGCDGKQPVPETTQETTLATVGIPEPDLEQLRPHLELVSSALATFYGIEPGQEACFPIYESREAFESRESPVGLTLYREEDLYSDQMLYAIQNVRNQKEWLAMIRSLLTRELADQWQEERYWEDNVLEFVGVPYFIFGSKGYGAITLDVDSAVLTMDSKDRCTVTLDSYFYDKKDFPFRVSFVYADDDWRVADYQGIYP